MTATIASPISPIVPDAPLDDEQRAKAIRIAVRARSRELRERYPILRHQSAIGATILAVSAIGVVASGVAYALGATAWWVVLPLSAIFMSLAHEIEHDQIHRLYFTRNKTAQNVVFAVCWLLRPYTISPWARRPLHLLHHEVSGTERDIEERAITNREKWRVARALMMVDPVASTLLRLPRKAATRRHVLRLVAKAYFPLTYIALGLWYSFLALGIGRLVTSGALFGTGLPNSTFSVLRFFAVVWVGPNVLRVTCLHFISSNMHYYGDVDEGNVIQQTQVLNHWWFAPLQLFCFNFGSSHGIHHFVPNDPFFVRQMSVRVAHRVMRENGVRFNDLGTFRRANRFHPA